MRKLIPALAATALALSMGLASAQTPQHERGMHGPKREAMKAAHEACKDKPDRHACMVEQVCAKSEDAAKCQERAKERHARMSKRMDERQQMHEACTGKRGDELRKCLGEQRQKSGHGSHKG